MWCHGKGKVLSTMARPIGASGGNQERSIASSTAAPSYWGAMSPRLREANRHFGGGAMFISHTHSMQDVAIWGGSENSTSKALFFTFFRKHFATVSHFRSSGMLRFRARSEHTTSRMLRFCVDVAFRRAARRPRVRKAPSSRELHYPAKLTRALNTPRRAPLVGPCCCEAL